MEAPSKKKPPYPVDDSLSDYLKTFGRSMNIPLLYKDLRRFTQHIPLIDKHGNHTLWLTVGYLPHEREEIHDALRQVYALLKASGEVKVMDHLHVDRIDFCEFGNSQPFRVRIVNLINDNQDYFYIKIPDASRIYGLELEHLLSPNRMHFLVSNETLVEEHVLGIPGNQFVTENLGEPRFKEIRIAKEFVKFNERCFIRLLGDMRSYNFVVDVTQDFEEVHYRIRPMDFDQQSYDGRISFYRPQYFRDNTALVEYGVKLMDHRSMKQYQHEERAAIQMRMRAENYRLEQLLDAMAEQPLAPLEKIVQLRKALAEHHAEPLFLECETMGELVSLNLQHAHRGTDAASVEA